MGGHTSDAECSHTLVALLCQQCSKQLYTSTHARSSPLRVLLLDRRWTHAGRAYASRVLCSGCVPASGLHQASGGCWPRRPARSGGLGGCASELGETGRQIWRSLYAHSPPPCTKPPFLTRNLLLVQHFDTHTHTCFTSFCFDTQVQDCRHHQARRPVDNSAARQGASCNSCAGAAASQGGQEHTHIIRCVCPFVCAKACEVLHSIVLYAQQQNHLSVCLNRLPSSSTGTSSMSGVVYITDEAHKQLLDEAYCMFSWTNPLHADVFPSVRNPTLHSAAQAVARLVFTAFRCCHKRALHVSVLGTCLC